MNDKDLGELLKLVYTDVVIWAAVAVAIGIAVFVDLLTGYAIALLCIFGRILTSERY